MVLEITEHDKAGYLVKYIVVINNGATFGLISRLFSCHLGGYWDVLHKYLIPQDLKLLFPLPHLLLLTTAHYLLWRNALHPHLARTLLLLTQ